MRNIRFGIGFFLAAVLVVLVIGCGRETVNIPDTTPPKVTATTPAQGATAVALNATITATFSKAMNPATINATTFTVTKTGGTAVTGTVTYAASGSIATFNPTSALAPGTQFTATITTGTQDQASPANALAANYVWSFTTGAATSNPPTVTSTTPLNGATGLPINQSISATFNEAMNPATINAASVRVTGTGGASVTGTVTYSTSGSVVTFVPTVNLAYSTVYTVTITTAAADPAGDTLASNYVWTFTTAAAPVLIVPTVVSTIPLNAATGVPINQAIGATFSEPMNCATLTTPATTFTLTGPGATPVAGTVSCTGSVATFTAADNLAANTLYTATITTGATDTAGTGLAGNYVWSFITVPAPTPPTVISTVPANLATNVPIAQAILATFSEAMTAATVNTSTFTLAGPGSTAVTGTVTYTPSGSVATFTPAADLAYSTLYTATITTGVTGLTGAPMASNYVWTFTTAAAPNTTAPTVISTIPANLATNVPLNQLVSATFSGPMNPATINSTNFTLQAAAGGPVVGIVAYAAVGNTLTFTPAANLLASTQYTATITTGVTDLSGRALANNYIWTFTTGAATNTTPPALVSAFPANAATGVALNQAVSGTFNEAMNPLTISTSTFTVTGPGSTPVIGTVSYDAVNFIATFTPNSTLLPSTQYTATISSGVADLTGNPLSPAGGVPNPWIFTTGAAVVPPPVILGPTISLFGGFGGGAGMTNQGTSTVINGDIGTTGASTTMTGFYDESVPAVAGVYPCSYTVTPGNLGLVNGTIVTAPPPPSGGCLNEGTAITSSLATQAALEARTAYNTLQALPPGITLATNELGNRTLTPGVYTSTSFYQITTGPLTLDAQGDPNASWVFQIASSLTVGTQTASESVVLLNGAQAKNVFWAVGGLPGAVINYGGGGIMVGTIISQPGITVSSPGVAAVTTINGRVVALGASTTLVNTVINVPAQ